MFGAEQRPRNSYKSWEEEGVLPAVVVEFTSRKTRVEDVSEKMQLYERLRIPEYFLFDPIGDYLRPALRGYRMTPLGMYAPIASSAANMPTMPKQRRIACVRNSGSCAGSSYSHSSGRALAGRSAARQGMPSVGTAGGRHISVYSPASISRKSSPSTITTSAPRRTWWVSIFPL